MQVKRRSLYPLLLLGFVASCTTGPATQQPERNAANIESDLPYTPLTIDEQRIISLHSVLKEYDFNREKKKLTEKWVDDVVQNYEATSRNSEKVAAIETKLQNILHVPYVNNSISTKNSAVSPGVDRKNQGPEIRVTAWNVERGQKLEDIISLLSARPLGNGNCDIDSVKNLNLWKEKGDKTIWSDAKKAKRLEQELCALVQSDVIILNETDLNVCRSGNVFVAEKLARHLGMNFVFAPTFLESEPSKVGLVQNSDPNCKGDIGQKTLNLSGNAILSRFPIKNTSVIKLPVGKVNKAGVVDPNKNNVTCWDWHDQEIESMTVLDKGRGVVASKVFKEPIGREIRYGQRNAIKIDLDIPGAGTVTVVGAHLENKAEPNCRAAQANVIIQAVKSVTNPVIVGGDFNTTGQDGGRLLLGKTILKTVENQIVQKITSPGFVEMAFNTPAIPGAGPAVMAGKFMLNYLTTTQNPTRKNVKWMRPSPEGAMFELFKQNGYLFDSGAQYSLIGEDEGPWSRTNARDTIGFEATQRLNRTYLTWGVTKLDWFMVHPGASKCADARYARTMGGMFDGLKENFPSDHVPVSVMVGLETCR